MSPQREERRTVSDDDVNSEFHHKRKRIRRKRGGWRVRPGSAMSPEDIDETSPKRKCERQGMAPSNTTQFLLDDREARAKAEAENDMKSGDTAERHRIRSFSVGSEKLNGSYLSEQGSYSGDDEIDREFEEEYLVVKRERIQKMSKTELEQELLERDRDTESLHDQVLKMDTENRQLKELLQKSGIPYDIDSQTVTSSTTPTFNTSPRVAAK
ncbi:unnamed protein product [Caenorhabditis bovis]|uniref:Uncharacterized protein n=1 Tax=Caenorhabditis bovis TaxID=2654633 RepID=A0A8S1EMZ8_9PELO|nr:unnamed protein product [Caenorhabditis bovis]